MSWAIGFDNRWQRDIGYGVPCYCDHPDCNAEIDRGLSYVCGGEPYGGDRGCGLYFCEKHLVWGVRLPQLCERCRKLRNWFKPKPDHPRWVHWKATDESWADGGNSKSKMTEIYRSVLRSKITMHEDASGDTQRFRILYLSCGHWAMIERTNHKRPKQARCRTCEIRGGWDEEQGRVAPVTVSQPA